ncbi:MAG: type VI secretion system-associated FHA domain protein TagH [Steroidobacter sp.]
MILTLEVTGPQAQEMGAGHRKVFKAIGGTIGRLPDNDWVFPDPYVSGRHALIRYVSGKFFVEDTSTNGVFINSPEKRLGRGQPQQLHDGDLLYIDAYKINVSIQSDPAVEARNDPFSALKNGSPKAASPVPPSRRAPTPPPVPIEDKTASMFANRNGTIAVDLDHDEEEEEEEEEQEEDGSTEWYGNGEIAAPKPSSTESLPPQRPRLEIAKPVVARPSRPQPPEPRRQPPPSPKSTVGSGNDSQLQALLDAAGIEGLDPSTEAAETLGEMLRVALSGIMEVLRARERMKDDLRMRGTTFKAADNNPLKFSANVDDAFHNLLVKQNPAYLKPVDAFDAAFHDVRNHQGAFLAAMRLAFESTLSQFDPQRLQEEFDRQMKGSIRGVPAKLRYWDLYRDKYGELIKDAEAAFRTLFGDAFARAYEEHLERLERSGRPGQ